MSCAAIKGWMMEKDDGRARYQATTGGRRKLVKDIFGQGVSDMSAWTIRCRRPPITQQGFWHTIHLARAHPPEGTLTQRQPFKPSTAPHSLRRLRLRRRRPRCTSDVSLVPSGDTLAFYWHLPATRVCSVLLLLTSLQTNLSFATTTRQRI